MLLMIDLYTGQAEKLPLEELEPATRGLTEVQGEDGLVSWKGDEYIIVRVS